MLISDFKKNRSPSIFLQIFNFSNKEKAHCPYVLEKTSGLCCVPLWGKQKYQNTNACMKSKIVMFPGQPIIDSTQFITRPNLACSVANNDGRFFRFWYLKKPLQIDINIHLNVKETKPRILYQQCVVYGCQCDLWDLGYAGVSKCFEVGGRLWKSRRLW